MAVSGTLSNSHFAGLPIIYTAKADKRSNTAFHRIKLEVAVSDNEHSATFQFSSPTVGNEDIDFDISSAIRALADNRQPEAQLLSYPTYYFTVKSSEEYMIDGTLYTAQGTESTQGNFVYAGTLPDFYRLYSIWPKTWSTKPATSPEIAFTGMKFLVPGPAVTTWPSFTAPAVAEVTVPSGSAAGSNIYGITKPRDGYELRFINSLGVHENVFLTGYPAREVNITTEQFTISRQQTLTQFSRGLAVKSGGHERWRLSSGPLDEAWAAWYVHELLMVRWAWLGIGGHYIPCHILPEDTTTIADRQKADLLQVEFTAELDIEGSPLL